MSRVIKFRVWDSYKRKMTHWSELERGDFGLLCASFNEKTLHLNAIPFTGILDGKGKEIYLGDIVKLNDCFAAEVVFIDGSFSVVTKSVYSNKGKDVSLVSSFESIEIIGNIYQNPDLLNK